MPAGSSKRGVDYITAIQSGRGVVLHLPGPVMKAWPI